MDFDAIDRIPENSCVFSYFGKISDQKGNVRYCGYKQNVCWCDYKYWERFLFSEMVDLTFV